MAQFVYFAIANAMLASLLAVCLWCVSRWIRRPALLHLLWILVLVRLIAPPVLVFRVTGLGTWLTSTVPRGTADVAMLIVRDATAQQARLLAMVRQVFEQTNLIPCISLEPVVNDSQEQYTTKFVPINNTLALSQAAFGWVQDSCASMSRHAPNLLKSWLPIWIVGSALCGLIQLY